MNINILKVLFVFIGGGIGALSRYGLSGFIYKNISINFPFGTLAVNFIALFLLGIFWGFVDHFSFSSSFNVFFVIGFIGGFSTLASYLFETLQMLEDGQLSWSLLNVLATNILGFIALIIGIYFSKSILSYIK